MYSMITRILALQNALLLLFSQEFRNQETQTKPTPLEQLSLTSSDFGCQPDLIDILYPFYNVQQALEVESYVTVSPVPMMISCMQVHLELNAICCNMIQPRNIFTDLLKVCLVTSTADVQEFVSETL
jgi:hypothetical protein